MLSLSTEERNKFGNLLLTNEESPVQRLFIRLSEMVKNVAEEVKTEKVRGDTYLMVGTHMAKKLQEGRGEVASR